MTIIYALDMKQYCRYNIIYSKLCTENEKINIFSNVNLLFI